MQKRAYLGLFSQKTAESLRQTRLRARDDTSRRFYSSFHWRLYHSYEEPAYPSRNRFAPAQSPTLPGPDGWHLHRGEIGAVRDPQMIQALGHAPRTGLSAPRGVSFRDPGNECPRIALCGVEFVFYFLDIRRQAHTIPLKYEKIGCPRSRF
jgi:hypothetical protein